LVASGRIIIANSPGKFDFLSVDPQRHRLLAAHEKDGTADFFDLDANVLLGRVKTGPAVGIAVDPKTGNYFVSVQDDKRVAVVDAATLKETGSIAMDAETDAIIFDAEDRRVFVTNDNGRYVWVIDPDTLKVVAAIAIPGTPECMAHDAASHRVYLNLKSTSQVAAIDTRSNEIVAQWPTAPAAAPHGMAFDARTSLIFSSGDNGKLVAIDARSGRVTGSANIAAKVDQIAFDPDTRRVYCAGTGRMSVVQESGEGLQSLGEVETAATAKNVAVDPKTHAVWSTYTDGVNSYAASWTAR
jgi:DNA-binding beta-propeller fold protein YncE